jgi:hypothetical protein
MPDEVTIKPKSESPATPSDQTASPSQTHLVNLCALGLGVSFFLPWANVLFGSVSGFDLQKAGDAQVLLWLIPILCTITVVAGIAKRSNRLVGTITGLFPFIVGLYWYYQLGTDLFRMLTYGGYLSLICGTALIVLSRRGK